MCVWAWSECLSKRAGRQRVHWTRRRRRRGGGGQVESVRELPSSLPVEVEEFSLVRWVIKEREGSGKSPP